MVKHIKVNSISTAWEVAASIFPTDYKKDEERLMIIQDRCMKQCRQGASDFGLTVSSRCRLAVPKPQQQKPENKFAKYAN